MSEQKRSYTRGNMPTLKDNQTFNVWMEYRELNPNTDQSEQKTFHTEGLARDAATALSAALGELSRPPRPALIWNIQARVQVQSDILRDTLKDIER